MFFLKVIISALSHGGMPSCVFDHLQCFTYQLIIDGNPVDLNWGLGSLPSEFVFCFCQQPEQTPSLRPPGHLLWVSNQNRHTRLPSLTPVLGSGLISLVSVLLWASVLRQPHCSELCHVQPPSALPSSFLFQFQVFLFLFGFSLVFQRGNKGHSGLVTHPTSCETIYVSKKMSFPGFIFSLVEWSPASISLGYKKSRWVNIFRLFIFVPQI